MKNSIQMSKFSFFTAATASGFIGFSLAIGANSAAAGNWNGSNMSGGGHGCYGSCWNGSNSSGTNNSNSSGGNHGNCNYNQCSNNSNSSGTNNSNSSGGNTGSNNNVKQLINELRELISLLYGSNSAEAKNVDSLLAQLKDSSSLSESEWGKNLGKASANLERIKGLAYQLTNRLLSRADFKNPSSKSYLAAQKSCFVAIGLAQAAELFQSGNSQLANAKLQQAQQRASRLIADLRSFGGSW